MWRERLEALTEDAAFVPPTDRDEIARAEQQLGGPLPAVLVELLLESDGIVGEHGLGLVWPLRRIVADNLTFRTSPEFRNLYMPFDPLLFFADAGNGDQFALLWTLGRDDVFVWDHETDSRTWVAPTVERYLQWWPDGTLRI